MILIFVKKFFIFINVTFVGVKALIRRDLAIGSDAFCSAPSLQHRLERLLPTDTTE